MTDEQLSDIQKAIDKIGAQRDRIGVYYRYYAGEHIPNFASAKFRNKFGARLKDLTDNLCKPVVNAPVSRLEVINFAQEGKDIDSEAWRLWKRNKMPLRAKNLHREAFRTGFGFVIVWQGADGKATIDVQKSHSVALWQSEETEETGMAAKLWLDSKYWYLTLYYADRIEKYVTKKESKDFPRKAAAFVERENAAAENPFGRVPVFKFSASEDLSILADVIPLNDALNKTFCDLMVGAEYNSIRQRFSTGIQYEKDEETGKPIIPYEHDDTVWSSESDTAKFGEFTDSDLEKFLKAASDIRQEIARVTGIPAHYFQITSGDFPSGEALKTAESRFVSMIEEAQLSFGESWSEVIKFALFIEKSAGESDEIETQWKDAAPVSQSDKLANALIKQQLGLAPEIYLAELGYTDEQIKDSLEKLAAKQQRESELFAKKFDGGFNEITDDSDLAN
jgi:hypothetical protein